MHEPATQNGTQEAEEAASAGRRRAPADYQKNPVCSASGLHEKKKAQKLPEQTQKPA